MKNSDQIKKEIGERIRQLRIQKGMSQEELATAVGYKSENSRSTVNKVEKGINDITQSRLKAYAKALGTTVAYLLGYDAYWDKCDKQFNSHGERNKESIAFDAVERAFGKEAVKLLILFSQLNEQGKEKALDSLYDLTEIIKYTEQKGE